MTRREKINYLLRHTNNVEDDLIMLSDKALSNAVEIINKQTEQNISEAVSVY